MRNDMALTAKLGLALLLFAAAAALVMLPIASPTADAGSRYELDGDYGGDGVWKDTDRCLSDGNSVENRPGVPSDPDWCEACKYCKPWQISAFCILCQQVC